MVHKFFKSFSKLLLYIFHFDLILKMKLLLLQIELISPDNKLLQSIENVLLDQPQIIVEFFPMYVVLDLIVETYPLNMKHKIQNFCSYASSL